MAQKKNHEVESWIARPDPACRMVLVYGPDRGLVSERAMLFARSTGLALDDPFQVVKLDAGELDSDPSRLADEAHTVPMFGDRRLIWVRNAGTQKAVTDAIRVLVAEPSVDSVILLEAGDLKKSAAIRVAVERAGPEAMALPCYADDARGIEQLIDSELGKAGLSIALDARQLLKESLGGDRLASRGEIEKLALYCRGRQSVELDDVKASIGDVSAISLDEAVDSVLCGELEGFDSAFSRILASGTPPFLLLAAAMRQFQALQLMRQAIESDRKGAAAVVASARPPIFFKRRKLVEQALSRWDGAAIARALDRLQAAVLQTRRRPEIATAEARQALLALAVEGARRARGAR